jgi:glycosyltransferase involved in cell wall biosynthesis
MTRRLVVLLPVRNGSHLLGAWLESVAVFADEVIALDDGSTDDTAAVLAAHPLVGTVLSNPRRPGYDGWDDHVNRTRLLEAVTPGDWVLFLDVDERLPAEDADALRSFAFDVAEPAFAYGFEIHRATDDLGHYDPAGRWVYRMFAREEGQTFPDKRLHFVPIPTAIPRRKWLRTSIRLLHVATTAAEDGALRVAKYREADGDLRWQDSYDHLADPPGALVPVPPREGPLVLPIHVGAAPGTALSAIVISRNDEERIERCVRAVVEQEVTEPFEVIVVTSGTDGTAGIVRRKFPQVRVVELDRPALPGGARNAGLAVAGGDVIAFPSSHIELAAGSLQARLDAHRDGWAMVTGPVINGNPTRAGWATYFLDHSTLLPDRLPGELETAPTRCSYVRFMLDQVGGFPEGLRAGEDTAVNLALWDHGFSGYREERAAEIHTSLIEDRRTLIKRHYERGLAWAGILLERHGSRRAVVIHRWPHLLGYLPRRLWRIHRNVRAWGAGLRKPYRHAWPLIAVGALAAWRGLLVGVMRGKSRVQRQPMTAGDGAVV